MSKITKEVYDKGLTYEEVGDLHDTIRFTFSDNPNDHLDVVMNDGSIEVRCMGGGDNSMCIKPVVGNAVKVSLTRVR